MADAGLDCGREEEDCYDKPHALRLKVAAIAVILVTSALGVLIPLTGRKLRFLRPEGQPFFITKVFAAGVILATAFIHMLPTAFETLSNPCLPEHPWGKFAWAGFISMLGALATLVLDVGATEFYFGRHKRQQVEATKNGSLGGDVEGKQSEAGALGMARPHGHSHEHDGDDMFLHARHVVVAQVRQCVAIFLPLFSILLYMKGDVTPPIDRIESTFFSRVTAYITTLILGVFEFGVLAHSVIIGITVGVSNSPCTIEPLFAALTFHQFFEGLALGGCIAMAGFRNVVALVMGFFFAVTTPLGVAIGIGITKSYNENSKSALIVEGVFDSISGGILLYMALVDLIAVDFLSKRMRSSRKLQVMAFVALFLGCGCMSVIGVWA